MTTPSDPFSAPPTPPGVIPNAAPPPPPVTSAPPGYPAGQYANYPGLAQYAPQPPRTLALWAIILTGVYTLVSLGMALLGDQGVETMRRQFDTSSPTLNFNAFDAVNALTLPVIIGAWVVLALWWGKVRQFRAYQGYTVGGIPAVEWWGWIVPLANFVLPILGMRSLTKHLVGLGPVLGWWIPYIASGIVASSAGFLVLGAMDWNTGEIDPHASFDGIVPIYWASAILILISWGFLTYIIRTTTERLETGAGQQ